MKLSFLFRNSIPVLAASLGVMSLFVAALAGGPENGAAASVQVPPAVSVAVTSEVPEPVLAPESPAKTPEIAETPAQFVSLKVDAVEAGYGTITGQILYDGEVPERQLAVKKGDPTIKDSAVCAAQDLLTNDLIVDPKTNGVANVFVYIYHPNIEKQGIKIHPEAAKIEEKELVFDQKNCRFTPHVMVIRTGQTVRIKSADNCAHNTHTNTIFNDEFNSIIAANDRKGVLLDTLNVPESLPMPVKCDIHPWMKAHWLIINHPYATVTDAEGRFTIEKLPVGEIEFRIWHERPGYIDRKYVVTVKEGKTELDPVKVPASKFELE